MRRHLGFALAVSLALACAPAAADAVDTVKLGSGKLLRGSVKSVTAGEVVIEQAGRDVVIDRGEASAIYFGRSAADHAALLDALRALAQNREVSFPDYHGAVMAAREALRPHLEEAGGEARRRHQINEAFRRAFDAHSFLRAAWARYENARAAGIAISSEAPLLASCPELRSFLRTSNTWSREQWHAGPVPEESYVPGWFFPEDLGPNLEAFWECAESQLAEAERLIEGR